MAMRGLLMRSAASPAEPLSEDAPAPADFTVEPHFGETLGDDGPRGPEVHDDKARVRKPLPPVADRGVGIVRLRLVPDGVPAVVVAAVVARRHPEHRFDFRLGHALPNPLIVGPVEAG